MDQHVASLILYERSYASHHRHSLIYLETQSSDYAAGVPTVLLAQHVTCVRIPFELKSTSCCHYSG